MKVRVRLIKDQYLGLEERYIGEDLRSLKNRGPSRVNRKHRPAGELKVHLNVFIGVLVKFNFYRDPFENCLHVLDEKIPRIAVGA